MNLRVLKSQLSQLMHIWTNRIRSQELPTDGPLDEDGLCFVMALEGLSWSWQGFIVQAMLWLRLPAPYIKKLCSSLAKDMYVRTYMYIYACFLIQCLALKLLGIRHLVGNSSANFYFRVRNGWVSIHTTFSEFLNLPCLQMLPWGGAEQEVSHFKSALEHLDVKLRALQKKQAEGWMKHHFWERSSILDNPRYFDHFYIIWKGAI